MNSLTPKTPNLIPNMLYFKPQMTILSHGFNPEDKSSICEKYGKFKIV